MTWFASVKAEIDALPNEAGWLDDGEGEPVTDVARFVAAAWAYALDDRLPIFTMAIDPYGIEQNPRVFPTESGGVSLEWLWAVDGRREDAIRTWLTSLEVDADGSVTMCEDVNGRITTRHAPTFDQLGAALVRTAEEVRRVRWMQSAPVPDTSILAYRPKGNPPDA